MTIVELFHRIGRRARGGDFTKLSMTEQTDIQDAANAALQECYNAVPSYFKEITEGFLLPAPQAITLAVVQYSSALSSSVFTDAQIGRSVVLDGDPAWNQVVSPDTLLNPYMGATGTVNGTIYGDAVYSTRYPFDRIIGNPTFANQTGPLGSAGGQMVNLTSAGGGSGGSMGANWWWQYNVGVPQGWWVQMLGNSQGNEPLLVLRFAPAPSQAYAVDVRMSYWPKRLTLSDYNAASTITVPDQFLEAGLIPLALRALMSSPIWESKGDENFILERAANALTFCKNQYSHPAVPNVGVFTPWGW